MTKHVVRIFTLFPYTATYSVKWLDIGQEQRDNDLGHLPLPRKRQLSSHNDQIKLVNKVVSSSCCFSVLIQGYFCRQMELKTLCVKLWDCFTRYRNVLVAKWEQILCVTSCEFDERATELKYVADVDPLTTIRNNNLITQCEKLETSAKFCIEYIIANIHFVL